MPSPRRSLVLWLVALCMLAGGCTKAARQGAVDGVTTGVSTTISALFDAIVVQGLVGE